MDGEDNAQAPVQQEEQQPMNLNENDAQLVQEEAFLEAQAQTLAEVKRRRKE